MRNTQRWIVGLIILTLSGCATDATRQNIRAGYRALDEQQYEEALSAADKQLQNSPRGPGAADAWYLRGRALEGRTVANQTEAHASFSAARDAYQQALRLNPSAPLEGRIHAGLANASYYLDDYATAQSEWMRAYEAMSDQSARSYMLYRIGLCHQRLGEFTQADQTFARVQQEFPGSEAAEKAKKHQGYRAFSVQLATYANAKTAEGAMQNLRGQGMNPAKAVDGAGRTVLTVGPAQNYSQAMSLKNRFAGVYPDALILP
jgi:tetratricopeptide (TPR) repeat protein